MRHECRAIVLIEFFGDGRVRLTLLYIVVFLFSHMIVFVVVKTFVLPMPHLSTFLALGFLIFELCDLSRSPLSLLGKERSLIWI